MSVLLQQLGDAQGKMKQFEQARVCNNEAQAMITEALHNDPKNVSIRLDLISALHARGVLERSADAIVEAKAWFQKALDTVSELETENKLVGADLQWRTDIELAIKPCSERLNQKDQIPRKETTP